MIFQPELAAVVFGLAASASWGVSDFSGGFATKRSPVLGVVVIAHFLGFLFLLILALATREPFPVPVDLLWGAISGLSGLVGLVAFYRALATGRMGIAAPITAIIAAVLPVMVGIIAHGIPVWNQLLGIVLGVVSVWLISYSRGAASDRRVYGLVIVAGLGFGGFLALVDRVSPMTVFWPLVASRLVTSAVTLVIVLSNRQQHTFPQGQRILLVILAVGVLDVTGNIFFVLARQGGRLDIAGVMGSLYPGMTILMARLVLKEHMSRVQVAGIVVALAAIALIAVGG